MPLPLILGVAAGIAALGGVAGGVRGAVKMKQANDTVGAAERRHKKNIERFDTTSLKTNQVMDNLGTMQLEILHDFDEFSNVVEKIQNRPAFTEYSRNGVTLPKYNKKELKKVSVGAGILLGGLGGAAVGTAGGFAAAGATTSAVMALGTASTGTAIATLSGAAATNATLAALGGGAIAAGGGGIALGTTILGASTLGAGLLVGGIIFNFAGSKMTDKADKAWDQMLKAERTIDKACEYLIDLRTTATEYINTLTKVRDRYKDIFGYISYVVNGLGRTDFKYFSYEEEIALHNATLLVGLLYKMCKVNLVNKAPNDEEMNSVNRLAVNETIREAETVMISGLK